MDLKTFLKVVTLNGKSKIDDLLLETGENTIIVKAKSPNNTSAVYGQLKIDLKFKDKLIGISSCEKLINCIDTIGDSISIKDNRIIIKGENKKASLLLKDPKFVTSISENIEKFKKMIDGSEGITFNVSILKNIQKYISNTGANFFTITIKGQKLIINVGEDNTDHITEELDIDSNQDVTIKLGQPFLDVIQNLDGDITLKLGSNTIPIVSVRSTTDNSIIEILIAKAS